jgi:serine/tyrosine/threonine adenylyltransferase
MMNWNFDNSFARDMEGYYAPSQAEAPSKPALLLLNSQLDEQLGLTLVGHSTEELASLFSGAQLPDGAQPIALAYAGHQFGHFSPQLGDGRALLLGELITPAGERFDMQLKGSGRTPYSRNGDGKSALGPVLREYLFSEAMYAMGIRTTRSLAAVATGEQVYRERIQPGGVLTRIAASHIRVGTVQFVSAHMGPEYVRKLADYVIARHYPAAGAEPNPYYALLEAVMTGQIDLVASWMSIGFVHGVMNTDNVTLSGETIDYGPCAFLDSYSAGTVFSSIDKQGRYAFGSQSHICHWNMSQLAVALVAVIGGVSEADVEKTQALINAFPEHYLAAWANVMRPKLGLFTAETGDISLINGLFAAMEGQNIDFTNFFRSLSKSLVSGPAALAQQFSVSERLREWYGEWEARIAAEPLSTASRIQQMNAVNPLYIPRNHKVEEALAAAETGDMAAYHRLLEAVTHPYAEREEWSEYAMPAPTGSAPHVTFCGT